MSNADQKRNFGSGPGDKASRRIKAILEQRIQMPPAPEEQHERSVRKGRKKNKLAPSSPAGFRLQAIQQYREAQLVAEKDKNDELIARDPFPGLATPGGYWLPIGPFGVRKGQAPGAPVVSGRVSRIALSPDGKRVYLATANSGVWRSLDQGRSWQPLMGPDFDQNPAFRAADSLACGAIAVVTNPITGGDDIYVGTGEGDAGDYSDVGSGQSKGYFGVGPLYLKDGTVDWVSESVAIGPNLNGQAFFGMAVHNSRPDLVIAATSQGVYKRRADASWVQLNNFPGPTGALFAPNFCAGVAVSSEPTGLTFFVVISNGVYQSTDDGATWSQVGLGFPAFSMGVRNQRTRLAVKPDDSSVVYALVPSLGNAGTPAFGQLLGLYRWERGDNQWRKIEGIPERLFGTDPTKSGQGNYDNALVVDPNNVNRLFIGGSTVSSDDEGFLGDGSWAASLYRCLISVERQAPAITRVSALATFVGGAVHADVHDLVFPPGNSRELWVGCDGGVFHTTWSNGQGLIFRSRNHGLQTMTMNNLDIHPTTESILFSGTQDNGGLIYQGAEEWMVVTLGDCGYCVVNWHNPAKVVNTYTKSAINRSTSYGKRNTYSRSGPGLASGENCLFYAPLVGMPPGVGGETGSNLLAFGSERLWLSENFGTSWRSIPNNQLAGDTTGSEIRAIAIASATKLYVGNEAGQVFRYEKINNLWQRNPMVDLANALPGNRVTDIALDSTDATGDTIYITIGGIVGNDNHVWKGRYIAGPPVAAQWSALSGIVGKKLPDVHHSTLLVDPSTRYIYTGADIGVWYTKNTVPLEWLPFSEGLPDAAVLDLKLKGNLLRVSTHGRGVFERRLDQVGIPTKVKLFLRNTILDTGERNVANPENLKNPLNPDENISLLASPDISVEAPNADGSFRSATALDFIEFVEHLRDDTERVPTHQSPLVRSRVYIRIHNKGIGAADQVRVALFVAPSSNGIPPVPPQLADAVAQGRAFNTSTWKTIGMQYAQALRVGQPQVLTFELPASLLQPPDQVTADTRCCLLAVLHHAEDPYQAIQFPDNSFETNAKNIATQQRHLALRQIRIVKFEGTPPLLFPYRPLPGFTVLPASATAANAPFDAFLGQTLSHNDALFNQLLSHILLSPLANNATDDANLLDPEKLIFAEEININNPVVASNVPLIWCAQKSITIKALVDASGKGAPAAQDGDFGGSGGGGGTNSANFGTYCKMPVSGIVLLQDVDGQHDGRPATLAQASRALSCLSLAKGGAGGANSNNGADAGGAGGGVVVFCAPLIKIEAGGSIDASGKAGIGSAGGGGGGLVILIANEFQGVTEDVNVKVAGGAKGNNAGNGGKGFIFKKSYA